MREIKFRAWDSDKKCMQYEEATEKKFSMKSCEILAAYDLVMQYTGLKDKNGKEIYESDILHIEYADAAEEENNFNTEVWFHEGKFLTRYFAIPVASFSNNQNISCEVVGNIYENSERLKEP